MGNNKEHFTIYYNEPVQSIPVESREVFVEMIKSGKSPSAALKIIIEKYQLERLDHSITLALLTAAYPNADLMDEGLKSRIIDSNYPNLKNEFTDRDLDEIIHRIKDGHQSW
jgi:hypothetical protein